VERKSCNNGSSLREKSHTSVAFVLFVMLLAVDVKAQTGLPSALGQAQPSAYGIGVQTPLRYAGESVPGNQLSLGLGVSTFYDDNVFQLNSRRVGDEAVSFDSRLALLRQTDKLTMRFDYSPYFLLYRQTDQLDRLNHEADLNLTSRLSSHFNLGLYGTFSYQDGVFQSLTGQQIMSGLSSPTILNQTILPYTTRTLTGSSGLNLSYVKNSRTSLTLAGGYNQQEFGSQVVVAGQSLYNSRGVSGSFQYQYRITEHIALGLLLLHQDSTFKGGEVFGSNLRYQGETALFSVGSRLSPTVGVTIFGGSQYIRVIGQSAAGAGISGQFQPSGGGSITKEVRKTALNLSLQRSVSGSGGLYTLVKNTTGSFGVRRRLVGRWEANFRAAAARADTSLIRSATGRTDALTGSFGLDRPLPRGSVFRISYDTTHELSKGNLPISSNFDHNRVTAGIDCQLKAISLGR